MGNNTKSSPHQASIRTRKMNDFYYSGVDFGKVSFDRFMKASANPSDCKTYHQRNPNAQLPFDIKPQVRPLSIDCDSGDDLTFLKGRPKIQHASTSLAIPMVGKSYQFGNRITDKADFAKLLSSP